MLAHCRNGTGATGQAFCVLARGRLMWYVYHVTLVGVARSWAAMSLLARSGYVVLHALGLRCSDVVTQIYAHQTTFNTERLPGVLIMARWTTEPFPTLSACPACCIRFNGSTKSFVRLSACPASHITLVGRDIT